MNPITKILKELEGSPYNQERFNKINRIHVELQDDGALVFLANGWQHFKAQGALVFPGHGWQHFEEMEPSSQKLIIQTALSRVDGEAVIDLFEGKYNKDAYITYGYGYEDNAYISDILYSSIEALLMRGATFDKVIAKLHHIMQRLNLL